jgi:hypothetical protein
VPVNIAATFKKADRPMNGLEEITDKLADERLMHAEYVVVATVRPKFAKIDAEDGSRTPTIRFDHIEVMEGDAADAARKLLDERYSERTGRDPQQRLDFGVDGEDGERQVPEASGEEILAERREAREAEALNAEATRVADEAEAARGGGEPA